MFALLLLLAAPLAVHGIGERAIIGGANCTTNLDCGIPASNLPTVSIVNCGILCATRNCHAGFAASRANAFAKWSLR